jgi:hypothetical protein
MLANSWPKFARHAPEGGDEIASLHQGEPTPGADSQATVGQRAFDYMKQGYH